MKRIITAEVAHWMCRMWEFYDNLSQDYDTIDLPVVFNTMVSSGLDDAVVQVRLTYDGFHTRMSDTTDWGDPVIFEECEGEGVEILRSLYKRLLVK